MNEQKYEEPKTQPHKKATSSNFRIVIILISTIAALCLLAFVVTRIIPKRDANTSSVPAQTAYSAKLVCSDCASVGIEIYVWQNAGTNRGSVVYGVLHNTTVTVIQSKLADDGRTWYKVIYNGKSGWIADDFVQR